MPVVELTPKLEAPRATGGPQLLVHHAGLASLAAVDRDRGLTAQARNDLAPSSVDRLIDDLLKCDNPFVCPHGRPVIISLSNWELDRKFRRT